MNNPLIRYSLLVIQRFLGFLFLCLCPAFSCSCASLAAKKCWSMSKSYVIHLPLDVCVLQCSLFLSLFLSVRIVLRIEFIDCIRTHVYIGDEEEKKSRCMRNEKCQIRYAKKIERKNNNRIMIALHSGRFAVARRELYWQVWWCLLRYALPER